jgi:hypothetical protein
MFRAPLCPSSGAGDYTDVHSMWHITLVMAGCRLCVRVDGCCSSKIRQPSYNLISNYHCVLKDYTVLCIFKTFMTMGCPSTYFASTFSLAGNAALPVCNVQHGILLRPNGNRRHLRAFILLSLFSSLAYKLTA